MSRQRELFQKMHPEQFSDSIIIKKVELDKDFMDYYLEKILDRLQLIGTENKLISFLEEYYEAC